MLKSPKNPYDVDAELGLNQEDSEVRNLLGRNFFRQRKRKIWFRFELFCSWAKN